jgi:type II secretory pathway pseudopilin PulG
MPRPRSFRLLPRPETPAARAPGGGSPVRGERARGGAEAGDTLIELMITVAILGLAMVAILGAIWTTLRVADFNSRTSSADSVVRGFAETMKEAGATDVYHYVPCTVAGGHVTYPAYDPAAPYQHYDATVEQIRYLNGYTSQNEPIWADACPSATDGGLQELTLRVTGPDNDPSVQGSETVTIVKRDTTDDVPRSSTDPENP